MSHFIFLDTNIFLHYQDFDRIDWKTIIGTNAFTIVIPPITIRELNKQKDTSTRTRIRNRAASTLQKLFAWFEVNRVVKLNENIDVILEDRDPLINLADLQLSREVQDDHLIASAVMYQSETVESVITIITSDVGLTLTAKANRLRINTKRLDDHFKLPIEPDPTQLRVKELEQKLSEFRQREPRVSLTFRDQSQHKTFRLTRPIQDNSKDEAKQLNESKQRYPKLCDQSESKIDLPKVSKGFDVSFLKDLGVNVISPRDIARYNAELDDFYVSYLTYIEQKAKFTDSKLRTIKLSIWITNEGTAPADDIDVFMHYPDGFLLLKKSEIPSEPTPPQPPSKPVSVLEQLRYTRPLSTNFDLPSSIFRPPNVPAPLANISAPRIKRSNSYDVTVNVCRLKHNLREQFDSIYLVFPAVDTAQSFHIDYEILAANLPNKQCGQLHVIIEKP